MDLVSSVSRPALTFLFIVRSPFSFLERRSPRICHYFIVVIEVVKRRKRLLQKGKNVQVTVVSRGKRKRGLRLNPGL